MNIFENLLAYDFERNQICTVYKINTEKNHEQYGSVLMNNEHVTFSKNHLLKECIILQWTGQRDSEKELIYSDDLLEDEKTIYRVEWNQQQTCWWLKPVKIKKPNIEDLTDNFLEWVIYNQQLGNGYFSRKDLKKIGNYLVDKDKFELI